MNEMEVHSLIACIKYAFEQLREHPKVKSRKFGGLLTPPTFVINNSAYIKHKCDYHPHSRRLAKGPTP